jgi:hypothetical protein
MSKATLVDKVLNSLQKPTAKKGKPVLKRNQEFFVRKPTAAEKIAKELGKTLGVDLKSVSSKLSSVSKVSDLVLPKLIKDRAKHNWGKIADALGDAKEKERKHQLKLTNKSKAIEQYMKDIVDEDKEKKDRAKNNWQRVANKIRNNKTQFNALKKFAQNQQQAKKKLDNVENWARIADKLKRRSNLLTATSNLRTDAFEELEEAQKQAMVEYEKSQKKSEPPSSRSVRHKGKHLYGAPIQPPPSTGSQTPIVHAGTPPPSTGRQTPVFHTRTPPPSTIGISYSSMAERLRTPAYGPSDASIYEQASDTKKRNAKKRGQGQGVIIPPPPRKVFHR